MNNNYGAAGSNAASIVVPAPATLSSTDKTISLSKFPVYLSAHSKNSLQSYRNALQSFVTGYCPDFRVADLAYNLAKMQNRSLEHGIFGIVTSVSEFSRNLETFQPICKPLLKKPVILVFGGQTKNHVGLDEQVCESSKLFHRHLDVCNEAIRAATSREIFPAIFKSEPVHDVVPLASLHVLRHPVRMCKIMD